MAELDMKYAVNRYNKLMYSLCLEYLTIGTRFSEDTDGWNIRDLVSECQYQYNLYFESGTSSNTAYSGEDGPDAKADARAAVLRLKRFIAYFAPFCKGVTCKQGHCSEWDNR